MQTDGLGGLGKADSITTEVVDSEVAAEEDITNDPKRTPRQVDVHGSERTDASVLHVQDVVRALDRVGLAVEVEGELGQARDLLARNGVLAIPRFGGADAE